MTYIPDEDSFLIKKHAEILCRNKKCLDMGTGSGIIAKAMKKAGAKSILAADIEPQNIKEVPFVQSNLFSSIKEKFDLIVFNPPYLPFDNIEGFENDTTGGKKGNETILKFLEKAKNHLTKGGFILLLYSSLSKPNIIRKKAGELGYKIKILEKKRIFFEELSIVLLKLTNH